MPGLLQDRNGFIERGIERVGIARGVRPLNHHGAGDEASLHGTMQLL